jgi:hypothetical protein
MGTFYVAANLSHDGRAYERGEKIDMPEEQAEALLAADVLSTEPVQAAPMAPRSVAPEPQPEAEVGGERTDTGEPSIDGAETKVDADVTEITSTASTESLPIEPVVDTPSEGTVAVPATPAPTEPVNDPSAEL